MLAQIPAILKVPGIALTGRGTWRAEAAVVHAVRGCVKLIRVSQPDKLSSQCIPEGEEGRGCVRPQDTFLSRTSYLIRDTDNKPNT